MIARSPHSVTPGASSARRRALGSSSYSLFRAGWRTGSGPAPASSESRGKRSDGSDLRADWSLGRTVRPGPLPAPDPHCTRSEEHTSELQSRENLVCRLLLEKKKKY